jgi:Winged helix-turn helix
MTKEQKIIRAKVGLLELAKRLGNVSQACKMLGYSRDSFSRFQELFEKGSELALAEISRGKPILRKRMAAEIEAAVVALAVDQPAWGSDADRQCTGHARPCDLAGRDAQRLAATGPIALAVTTMKHRLKALEAKMAQDGLVLTEAQGWPWRRPRPKRRRTASSRASVPATAVLRTASTSAT